MKPAGKRTGWNVVLPLYLLLFLSLLGGNRSVNAAPLIVDPTIMPQIVKFQIGPFQMLPFTPITITNVTDNGVDDTHPSLNNGYAFWYREGSGIYRWRTSQDISTASKKVDLSAWFLWLSSYDGKVAFNTGIVRYWDGSSTGTVAINSMLGVSLYGDSIAYPIADGSDFEIVVKNGLTEKQITNDGVWDIMPSLYNGAVAYVHDYLGSPEIWYWDGDHKRQVSSGSQSNVDPSLYDGTIAWSGYDGSDYEIYYWDGTTITQITNDNDGTDDGSPSLYDGKIAWQRHTDHGWEIYYWDGSSVTRVTNNSEDDKYPSLYNGAILWQHDDGDWEIQYAEVDVPQAPTVSTLAASDRTQTTANINGRINPNGQATTYHFEWGASTSYGHTTTNKGAGSGTSSVNVYEGLTGLTAGTTYHYRLVAENPSGTTNGSDRQFTTESISVALPTATTGGAENITESSARLKGTVNPSGADTQYRFEYGGNSTSYGSHTGWVSAGNGSSDLSVAVDVGGLSAGTTYHYRLVAKNSAGTANGDDNTFTTSTVDDPMADTARRFNGWWYSSSEQGTGIAMEIQGSNIFLAWFVYDDSGRTFWYASGGPMTNDTTYTGDLRQWTGWPWGQAYSTPPSTVVGTITLIFNKGSSDSVIFNASVNGTTATGSMTSFMKDFSPGDKDSRDLTGWWWDPSYDGMGFFLDARGGKMAMVWYNYRDDNSARWWTSDGNFTDGAASYSDSLDGWQGGQCPGCTYTTPTKIPNAGGSINITFTDGSHATLINNGITVNLERFSF